MVGCLILFEFVLPCCGIVKAVTDVVLVVVVRMNNAATTERSKFLKEEKNMLTALTLSTVDPSIGDVLLDTEVDIAPFRCRCCRVRVD
eukprot:CAMPEP_0113500662 /NCGR_PEP_ID=MMETSP0014_2-20120614/32465_1 /TAXON_ID=2857 /ORGANISM="Nitzschia sp." /LENGTH=87 /DNA_ID=CAMNT_0000395047 /DNA_START=124 /DNA_END=384 /DNA_ORIENTATION=- /assembly_acc=CAM_ASM_000159